MSDPVEEALGALGLSSRAFEAWRAHVSVEETDASSQVEAPAETGAIVVLSGRLEVVMREGARVLSTFEAPAALSGNPAFAGEIFLRAACATRLLRIAPSAFEALFAADPDGLAAFVSHLTPGERAVQLALQLAHRFPGLDDEGLVDFAERSEWVSLRGGEVLFEAGDPADAAYFVISGRLRASIGEGEAEEVLNEVVAGETVGEMALIQADVRSATVYAVRDSQLARLSRDDFDALTERHPHALRRIAGFVVDRLKRRSDPARSAATATSFAVVPATPGVELRRFVSRLAEALGRFGEVERIDRNAVESALGRRGIADAADDDVAGIRLVRWLGERGANSRHVVYEADAQWTPWTERALRQADHVLVVALAKDGPAPGENERRLGEIWRKTHPPRRSLVLLHTPGVEPKGTSAWLENRDVERHFHVRGERVDDVERLARLLSGHGVGLVLGGGGARGFAHLGVLRALEEVGIPIDSLGGTSMGAIAAALPAIDRNAADALAVCRRSFTALFDPTLPIVSVLTGRRISERLASVIGSYEIEDLAIPFFCVSTNLSRAQEVVHQRGSLFQAVRSSISLPGILPPVSVDGDLHVDGGLMDNLPIETMAASCGGPVIAVNVSPEEDLRFDVDLARGFSGWRALWNRIDPRAEAAGVPTLATVLMRSVVVASLAKERERAAALAASLYLKMPVDEFGLLEFEQLGPIAQRGYEASLEPIRQWWEARGTSG